MCSWLFEKLRLFDNGRLVDDSNRFNKLVYWRKRMLKIEKEGERIMSGDGCRNMSGDGCTLPWKMVMSFLKDEEDIKSFFFIEKLCFHAPFFVCTTNALPCQQKGFNR